jgi:hypothetical protein
MSQLNAASVRAAVQAGLGAMLFVAALTTTSVSAVAPATHKSHVMQQAVRECDPSDPVCADYVHRG